MPQKMAGICNKKHLIIAWMGINEREQTDPERPSPVTSALGDGDGCGLWEARILRETLSV